MKHLILLPFLILLTLMTANAQSDATALPELLIAASGEKITTSSEWEKVRRPEILQMFQQQMYGMPSPDFAWDMEMNLIEEDRSALGGMAIRKQVDLVISRGESSHSIPLLIYLPINSDGASPVFLGLNFYGNQTIHPDRAIRITENWVPTRIEFGITGNEATHESRGVRYDRWPVEWILEQGYGIATMYSGDVDPDFHDEFHNGIHALEQDIEREGHSWGTIATWAWGLSRAMDYLETDEEVDGGNVVVFGHSRLGKTALWAGATDQRFAAVISNESGCGGAALSKRKHGETFEVINRNFPHWFCEAFHDAREEDIPFDQHMLIALMAPRPVYVASAQKDDWADPEGEYLSIYHAGSVYELYGFETLESPLCPGPLSPVFLQTGYHLRTGKHDHTRYDWMQFMEWVNGRQ